MGRKVWNSQILRKKNICKIYPVRNRQVSAIQTHPQTCMKKEWPGWEPKVRTLWGFWENSATSEFCSSFCHSKISLFLPSSSFSPPFPCSSVCEFRSGNTLSAVLEDRLAAFLYHLASLLTLTLPNLNDNQRLNKRKKCINRLTLGKKVCVREVYSFVLQFDSIPVSSVYFCVLFCFSLLLFGPLDGKPHDSRAYHKILYIVTSNRVAWNKETVCGDGFPLVILSLSSEVALWTAWIFKES